MYYIIIIYYNIIYIIYYINMLILCNICIYLYVFTCMHKLFCVQFDQHLKIFFWVRNDTAFFALFFIREYDILFPLIQLL